MKNIDLRRILALTIDLTIVGIIIILLENLFPFFFKTNRIDVFGIELSITVNYHYINVFLYFIFFDLFNNGNTIGKAIVKIKTISVMGEFLNLSMRILRSCVKVINIVFFPITLIVFIVFKGYTLHDELVTKVEAAIQALPEKQRMAVVLRRYEEMPYEEIGKVLKLSLPAVKSLLFRARTQLKESLAGYLDQ